MSKKSADIAVVVDGGKMKLMDRSGNILQSYYFHWLISGYHESKLSVKHSPHPPLRRSPFSAGEG